MSGRRHPNPVGWWQMENNLLDWSGEGNNGTVGAGSAAYAAGVFGRAWENDATRYVDCGSDQSLRFAGSFSVTGWVRIDNPTIVSFQFFRNGGSESGVFSLASVVSDNAFIPGFFADGFFRTIPSEKRALLEMTPFQCHFYAGIWDEENQELIAYLDQNRVTESFNMTRPENPNVSTVLGVRQPNNDRYLQGLLDDIRIYNAALSPSDIQRVYRGQQPARVY